MKSLIIVLIFSFSCLYTIEAQKNLNSEGNTISNEKVLWVDPESGIKVYWLDSQLYEFAKMYNLEDSSFVNSATIKSGYTLLRAYPKIELERYFQQKVKSIQTRKEWILYGNESKEFHQKVRFVKNTQDYINLLNKYPRYKAELIKQLEKNPDYENLETKLLSGEVRIAKMLANGEIGLVHLKYNTNDGKAETLPIKQLDIMDYYIDNYSSPLHIFLG